MKKTTANHHRSMQKKRRKRKLVLAPHKKRKVVRLKTQALCQLASGMEKIAAATLKKLELAVERDLKRKEMHLAFRREEAEKSREYELRMSKCMQRCSLEKRNPVFYQIPWTCLHLHRIHEKFYRQIRNPFIWAELDLGLLQHPRWSALW